MKYSKDNNGNHVIQKCLILLTNRNKQFIYEAIIEQCVEVSSHKHGLIKRIFIFLIMLKGCCVIQRCLDYGNKQQRESLASAIADNTLDLVKDQYGNYVVFNKIKIFTRLH